MSLKHFYILLILLLIQPLSFAEKKIVTIATLRDYVPFCFAEQTCENHQIIPIGKDSKDFKGYSWDIVRDSFHEMGYEINLFIVPWIRAMHYIETGAVDIVFPAGKNSQRQTYLDYSNESVNKATFVLYVKSDSNLKWNGLESLKGLLIGMKRAFNYGDEWEKSNEIKKHSVNTILQGFNMLKNGRLDGFVGYEHNWDYVLKQQKLKKQFKKFAPFDSSNEYLIALKKNPKGKQLLKAYDQGKEKLIKSGKLEKLKNKWF